jgi:ABC-2 type transport system ATP-binding protein
MIRAENISKRYADHTALNDVSLHIPKGSLYGLLGPNGAGKTTFLRILNQIIDPDAGQVLLDGRPLQRNDIARIGYLPEERGLYKKMAVGDQSLYLARLKGLSEAEAKKRLVYWFEKLGMESWWDKKIEELSKGMAQKVQFVTTVLHQPEVLIFDEPFSGFDPLAAQQIREEMLELHRNGTTLLFSTHRMENVEEMCTHIGLINKSRRVLEGSVAEVVRSHRTHRYTVIYQTPDGLALSAEATAPFQVVSDEALPGSDWRTGRSLCVQLTANEGLNHVLGALLPHADVLEAHESVPSMNDIFIQTVQNAAS